MPAIDDTARLPQLAGRPMVTDGGLETDLIFHHGVDLPLFAAFPLIDTAGGRSLLTGYYDEYAAIARRAGAGLMLESATWRANPDWGARLGYSPRDLDRVDLAAVAMLAELRDRYRATLADVVISGMVGPRGDGYQPGERMEPGDAAGYHAALVEALARAGADIVSAYTLTDIGEAIGIALAARAAGVPVAISFTTETDDMLAGGESWPRPSPRSMTRPRRRASRSTAPTRSTWPRPWPSRAAGTSGSSACGTTPPPGATPTGRGGRPGRGRHQAAGGRPPALVPALAGLTSWAAAAAPPPGTSTPYGTSRAELAGAGAQARRARTWARSPWRPKRLSSSTGPSSRLPNQCGTRVSNSAASPGRSTRSWSPSTSLSRPSRT